jgi:peptidoglycan/xylan/chitin deacetylase (PgdA/CDA1 family)
MAEDAAQRRAHGRRFWMSYPRDMIGYGAAPPHPRWPDKARIAVQFVLNYEEGAENSILHGDPTSEIFLSEIIGAAPFEGARHMSMESIYEYGSRAGVWRLLDLFRDRGVPLTLFAVAMAMQRHPAVIERALADGHEIASHGYRWINYHGMSESEEREHLQRAIEIHTRICGERPGGPQRTPAILSPPRAGSSMTPMIIPTICHSGARRPKPRI